MTSRGQELITRRVRAFAAFDHSVTHADGIAYAVADEPTVYIVLPDGQRFSWLARLCEDMGQATDEEFAAAISKPRPRLQVGEYPHVVGHCPMGCGTTLFLGEGGHVTCSAVDCTGPDAVDTLLGDRETEHIAVFTEKGWTLKHPLRERLADELLTCGATAWIGDIPQLPHLRGTFRVLEQKTPHAYLLEHLPEPAAPDPHPTPADVDHAFDVLRQYRGGANRG